MVRQEKAIASIIRAHHHIGDVTFHEFSRCWKSEEENITFEIENFTEEPESSDPEGKPDTVESNESEANSIDAPPP